MSEGRADGRTPIVIRLGKDPGVHDIDPADRDLKVILRAEGFEPGIDEPRVWKPPPDRAGAAMAHLQAVLAKHPAYEVVPQETATDRAAHRAPESAATVVHAGTETADSGTPTSAALPSPHPEDTGPTTDGTRTDGRPIAEPQNPPPDQPISAPDGPDQPATDDTEQPNPTTSPDPAPDPAHTATDSAETNHDPDEPPPYTTRDDAHAQTRSIDDAAHAWKASIDNRSDTPDHVRELRATLTDALRAARTAHDIHLGDPTDATDTPTVGSDNLRVLADHARTLVSTIENLSPALTARTRNPERAALRAIWQRARHHMDTLDATIRDLDSGNPRTLAWTRTHTTPPTEATPPTTTENPTTETAQAKPADAPTRPPQPATPPTDPPPPPRSEFDHWNGIALESAHRRHARDNRRSQGRSRNPLRRRHHSALIRAWNIATDPRVPPDTPSRHLRDLRDRGDRYAAVARAAARLTASPQRRIEREALHELRVAAELHARHLHRQADALDPPHRRPRLRTTRSPFTPRPPRRRPDPDTLLARVAEAEEHARQGIAGRDARAKAHLHATGPEHDRLVRDIRVEHATAHQVMRDVRDRAWWRRADPGQIAAVWQRAVEWSAHHDVAAAQILRHMQGRILQHHGVELPTPAVNGVNLNTAIARGHPTPAEGPAAHWTYTVRDPLPHTRLIDQGRHTALARDTPDTVGRRVLADLAARGTDPATLRRAVVEVVPADRPDAAPVVVTAARIPEIGRDQAARDRAEHDLAQAGAALKSALDHRWWEDARPVEIGWMWRGVQDWEEGSARTDALTFLADRVQAHFGITLAPETPAVVVTERVREYDPAPLDPTGAPERAVAAQAARLFDRAHRIEARIAAGDIPAADAPAMRQQARSHTLRARHLAGLASDPEEARHLLRAARPPAVDTDRIHRDIAAEYHRSWGRALTDDESARLRSILERDTGDADTDRTPAADHDPTRSVEEPPRRPTADSPVPPDTSRQPPPPSPEAGHRERVPAPVEPASRQQDPHPGTPEPTREAARVSASVTDRADNPPAQVPRSESDGATLRMADRLLRQAEDALAAEHARPRPHHRSGRHSVSPVGPGVPAPTDDAVPELSG
ncbi:hypothetical protein [Embleya scabrispora]|uniref:hypothetical protein n=1 Tax=Embleya scabrispora TaxID=159449 RepID=UPI00059360F5|nr:hypothetical protein [Embleya scabrispora]MYS81033.1 hypothetical protein [Streptomyces sp. SID5474]